MWSPDRRSFVLLLALGGCGFTPAYAPGGAAVELQSTIRMDDPTDKNGFDFVERMEERLGKPVVEKYELTYQIESDTVGFGEQVDNTTTRYNVTGTIEWGLVDLATGKRLTGGRATTFTGYSATGSTVAGLTAEEDASYRLMRSLADQIVTRLTATSAIWNQ
ncbi:LPS assembly lipoprotein LptE [Falsirhodobacter sp. alg1]|uniref:LPS assembly lipoprotein LptE n=1 Tax=Falsirhodobacter sp. alg1 TaxID=1472418 RepID=UPI0005EE954F|nr:LPS assembly lipoprotein LptE [Falsirhodobacter sp. alg1]